MPISLATATAGPKPSGRRYTSLALVLAAGAASLLGPGAASAQTAEALVGVDVANQLVSFSSANPRSVQRRAVVGLPDGERVLGLDLRPANGQLVALTTASRLYTIDRNSGQATAIGGGPFSPAVSGTSFGFDFNPTVDRIRLVANTTQNLRLHPDTGAVAATDGRLVYGQGDANAGQEGTVVASGYTNNNAGATSTILYGLDSQRDLLVVQDPPNSGGLRTRGALGVNIASPTTFDIAPGNDAAYVVTRVARQRGSTGSNLYRVDLGTGRLTLIGAVPGARIVGVAVG